MIFEIIFVWFLFEEEGLICKTDLSNVKYENFGIFNYLSYLCR